MNVLRIAAAVTLLFWGGTAAAWWNEDWEFRKRLAVDTSATGLGIDQGLMEVPMLLRLHLGNFQYFGDVQADGSDLRFVGGDDTTPLSFHIERFDPAAQVALIWVKLPTLTPGVAEQPFYMYYGNPDAPAAGNPPQTYDRSQTAVLHFDGDGAYRDVTAYGNHPTTASVLPEPAGLAGQAVRFGGSQSLRLAASPSLAFLSDRGWTLAAWLRPDRPQNQGVVLEAPDNDGGVLRLRLDGLTPVLEFTPADDGPPVTATASQSLQRGSWVHLALRTRSDGADLLINGNTVLALPQALAERSGAMTLGSTTDGAQALTDVAMDELRVSNTARSDSWLKVIADSQGVAQVGLSYGEDSSREAGETESHFTTTLRNVDWSGLEGWVIFLCIFISIFSWYVMVSKTVMVERVRRANGEFLARYREASEIDELTRDGGPEVAETQHPLSTLAEVYSLGMREIQDRIAHNRTIGTEEADKLSGESLDAIRVTLEGHNVRSGQRMNNLMVLLTLAISGGPFLGLLGTVVGVMVTFASIAAAGDVNINAIAPGIAAALVATVAGLGVAIPALFGYNYISSRIREVITEDAVFLDEFIAAAIETYQRGSRYAG